MTIPVTVDEFKAFFDRDFIYGSGKETVRDTDISKALTEAIPTFNVDLWETNEVKVAYYYCSAFFLVRDIQLAGGLQSVVGGQGINNRGSGATQSKSVGQVSVAYQLTEKFSADPILSQFLLNDYGQRYLQLVSTRLVGNAYVVRGFNDTGGPSGI